jgi:hypothetical protein
MRCLIAFLILFIPFISPAQKNFQPGYIVNLKGDTISGSIDYKEWHYSPNHILFKPSGTSAEAKEYSVNDISSFGITGMEAYRRSIVKISLHPAKVSELQSRDTSWKTDTVFLKLVQAGKIVSLFSYEDIIKERFYILEEGKLQPTELEIREYIKDGSTSLIREDFYKGQLKDLMYIKSLATNTLSERIDEAAYEERDLKKIILLMNKTGKDDQVTEKKSSKINWFAGAGLQQDELIFGGDIAFATRSVSNSTTWLPKISAGLDLFANPNVGKLFYRVEAGYQLNKATSTAQLNYDVKAVYTYSASTISLQPQLNYCVYNSARLKIPIGVGLAYNRMIYSKNQYKKVYATGEEGNIVDNWLELKKSATTFFARGAFAFSNKIEASLLYRIPTSLTNTAGYGLSTSSMQLQVYFLFRKRK